jgi:hypothetical protein
MFTIKLYDSSKLTWKKIISQQKCHCRYRQWF